MPKNSGHCGVRLPREKAVAGRQSRHSSPTPPPRELHTRPRGASTPDALAGPPPLGLPDVVHGGRLLALHRRPRVRRRRRVGPVCLSLLVGLPLPPSRSPILASLLAARAARSSTPAVGSALARATSPACAALSRANRTSSEAFMAPFASESLLSRTIAFAVPCSGGRPRELPPKDGRFCPGHDH